MPTLSNLFPVLCWTLWTLLALTQCKEQTGVFFGFVQSKLGLLQLWFPTKGSCSQSTSYLGFLPSPHWLAQMLSAHGLVKIIKEVIISINSTNMCWALNICSALFKELRDTTTNNNNNAKNPKSLPSWNLHSSGGQTINKCIRNNCVTDGDQFFGKKNKQRRRIWVCWVEEGKVYLLF